MENLKTLVDDLYDFRDHFFENHSIDEASKKASKVKKKLDEVTKELDKADKTLKSTAEYMMLYGKALNVTSKHNKQAEEMLSKAVKLDPKSTEAWINLGEIYWKGGNMNSAQNCFSKAVDIKKDKVTLRQLSMITRSMGSNMGEKCEKIECSFDMAKEALKMDLNDGLSWLSMGNAYIAKYFISKQDPSLLKQALTAFSKAEQDPVANNNFDLHYNKGTVHEYLENYEEALNSYLMSYQLDPTFEDGSKKEKKLLQYVQKFSALVNTKGGIKKKRIALLIKMINPRKDSMFLPNSEDLTIKTLPELNDGPNEKTMFVGRVAGSLSVDDPVCSSFVLVDMSENFVGVTLYNASRDWSVKIGDSVVISEPSLRHHNFSYEGNAINFRSFRVDSPMNITVNGKLGSDKVTPTEFVQSMKPE